MGTEPAERFAISNVAGDMYLVYPGARSSIRFEWFRKGIQDSEKIRYEGKASPPEYGPEQKQLQRLRGMLDTSASKGLTGKKPSNDSAGLGSIEKSD